MVRVCMLGFRYPAKPTPVILSGEETTEFISHLSLTMVIDNVKEFFITVLIV